MAKIPYEEKNFTEPTLIIIDQANQIIEWYQEQGFKLTLRQLYYQFVSKGIIPNTERSYKNLGTIISSGRRAGYIDWEAIEDRTRFLRKPQTWDCPESIINDAKDIFRMDLWADQDYRVEIWIEKDALIGVIEKVCLDNDVPFFSCRGYVSDSEMWSAAIRMRTYAKHGQEVIVFHLGDHDPSGIDMTRDIENRLELFSVNYPGITVERIALTMNQIEEQSPPPNPAKVTDSRYKDYRRLYGDESWELDALEPQYIVNLIQKHINYCRDIDRWNDAYNRQEEKRNEIERVLNIWDSLFSEDDNN